MYQSIFSLTGCKSKEGITEGKSSSKCKPLRYRKEFIRLDFCHVLCISLRLQSYLVSLLDGDLFDEAMDGGHFSANGRGEGSPDLFDLTKLGESLADSTPRKCKTPEQFLGPTAATLVDLDNLIPINSMAMPSNPFMSGIFNIFYTTYA